MKTATKTDKYSDDQYKDHTDTPWTLDEVWMLIKGPNGEEVGAIHSGQNDGNRVYRHIAQGNAELICRAVNCHAELLEACKAIQKAFRNCPPFALDLQGVGALPQFKGAEKALDLIDEAILKAESK